jgi:D-glycero-alpha-D-manno-heptose-7-phosphate kinase
MTNTKIDSMYEFALANGASGAKVVGAGGGGFLMTYSNNPKNLSEEMSKSGIRELEFSFDRAGTRELLS